MARQPHLLCAILFSVYHTFLRSVPQFIQFRCVSTVCFGLHHYCCCCCCCYVSFVFPHLRLASTLLYYATVLCMHFSFDVEKNMAHCMVCWIVRALLFQFKECWCCCCCCLFDFGIVFVYFFFIRFRTLNSNLLKVFIIVSRVRAQPNWSRISIFVSNCHCA